MPDRSCWYERTAALYAGTRRGFTGICLSNAANAAVSAAFPFRRPVAMLALRPPGQRLEVVGGGRLGARVGVRHRARRQRPPLGQGGAKVTGHGPIGAAGRHEGLLDAAERGVAGDERAAEVGPAAVDLVAGVAQARARRQDGDPRPRHEDHDHQHEDPLEAPQHGPSTLLASTRRRYSSGACVIRSAGRPAAAQPPLDRCHTPPLGWLHGPHPGRGRGHRSGRHLGPGVVVGAGPARGQPLRPSRPRAVDGDTIVVAFADGHTDTVRVLGVDTPETHDPRKPVQCFGPEAAAYTASTAHRKVVRLESDVETRDKYGRRLAYVYVDGRRFDDELLRRGYARLLVIEPNYRARAHDARRRARGAPTSAVACGAPAESPASRPACQPAAGGARSSDVSAGSASASLPVRRPPGSWAGCG